MAPIVIRYPLDPTGVDSTNLVQEEEHTLGAGSIKAFATHHGGFFSESVIVKDKNTQQILVKDVDYICAEIYEIPTKKYGKEITAVIVITNEDVSTEVLVSYQALGGPWSTSQQALLQLFDQIDNNLNPVNYSDIIGKPTGFNPLPHLHDAGDIYGLEYIVDELKRLVFSVMTKDTASHIEIYQYIDWLAASLIGQISDYIANHSQSGDHDWRYWTKGEADERYTIKGESIGTELDGATLVYQGMDYSWLITNYDSFSSYQVETNQGIVNINNDKIIFKMPMGEEVNTPLLLTVTRNNLPTVYEITILEAGILPPDILVNTGDNVCNLLTPTLTLSNFIIIPTGADAHVSTDMQLSEDIGFNTIIWERLGATSGSNKFTVTLPKLSIKKKYYFRGRFNGNIYTEGEWNTVLLSTHDQQVIKKNMSRNTTYAYIYQVPTSRMTYYNSYVYFNTSRQTLVRINTTKYTYSNTAIGLGSGEIPHPMTPEFKAAYLSSPSWPPWHPTMGNWTPTGMPSGASRPPGLVISNVLSTEWTWYGTGLYRGLLGYLTPDGATMGHGPTRLLKNVYSLGPPVMIGTNKSVVNNYNYDQHRPYKHLGGLHKFRFKLAVNTSYYVNTSWVDYYVVPVSRMTYYNSTIGHNTSTLTQYNTTWPVGRFTKVQKTVEVSPGYNTTFGAFTGYIKNTTKVTSRSTTWVTISTRTTTRNTSWLTNVITNVFNTSNYTCHGGAF